MKENWENWENWEIWSQLFSGKDMTGFQTTKTTE